MSISARIGSDGDPRSVLDLIDHEFSLPPDRIRESQVQFRPYEEKEIRGLALEPRAGGKGTGIAASWPRDRIPRRDEGRMTG